MLIPLRHAWVRVGKRYMLSRIAAHLLDDLLAPLSAETELRAGGDRFASETAPGHASAR